MRNTFTTFVTLLLVAAQALGSYISEQHPLVRADADGADGAKKGPFTNEFKKLVTSTLEKWRVPGVAISVVDGDNTWAEGFGLARIAQVCSSSSGRSCDERPVTASTLFYAGSTTKAFAAAALSAMVHSGNYSVPLQPQNQPPGHGAMPQQRPLSWSTPLVDVLGPLDFALEDPWATSHVTLDDAIGHRTGMPRHDGALRHVLTVKNEAARDGNVSDESSSRIASPVDVARMLRYLPLSAEPRMKFQYCNTMYTTLGLAVERLYDSVHGHSNSQSDHGGDGGGGKWLGHILRDWIWAPLGMHSTFFSLPDAQAAEARDPDAVMAQNYFFDYSSGEYRPVPPLPLEEVGAAGSVISSVADYARWMRALVARDDAVRASSVLTHDVLADMGTARTIISSRARTDGLEPPVPWDAGMAYGLGWLITSYRGYRILSHSGGTDGAGTEVFLVPELGFGVTTMANTGITSTAVGEVLAWRLIDDRLAVPKAERFDWDGKSEQGLKGVYEKLERAVDDLYPQRPRRPLRHSRPLREYTGTYYHPGYQYVTLQLARSSTHRSKNRLTLAADLPDRTWKASMNFEHVSGEYWVIYLNSTTVRNGLMDQAVPAHFQVGPDGKVKSLEIEIRSLFEDVVEGVIRFEKLE